MIRLETGRQSACMRNGLLNAGSAVFGAAPERGTKIAILI
jgi:hypothetical protein